MKQLACMLLLAILSLPALGQATKDRNLAATRRHAATTTLPPEITTHQGAAKDTNSQLDKLEHQTANTVIQPAAKAAKAPAYKLPSNTRAANGSAYEQTMPVHAAVKNGTGTTNRSSRSTPVKTPRR